MSSVASNEKEATLSGGQPASNDEKLPITAPSEKEKTSPRKAKVGDSSPRRSEKDQPTQKKEVPLPDTEFQVVKARKPVAGTSKVTTTTTTTSTTVQPKTYKEAAAGPAKNGASRRQQRAEKGNQGTSNRFASLPAAPPQPSAPQPTAPAPEPVPPPKKEKKKGKKGKNARDRAKARNPAPVATAPPPQAPAAPPPPPPPPNPPAAPPAGPGGPPANTGPVNPPQGGPGFGLAGVVNPGPKPPKTTFKENFERFKVHVPKKAGVVDTLKNIGIPVVAYEAGGEDPFARSHVSDHPISAAIRTFATAYTLNMIHKRGYRQVVDVFASDRTESILRVLQKGVPKEDCIVLKKFNPRITDKDIGRSPFADDVELESGKPIAYMMFDVYLLPDHRGFNPDYVRWLLGTHRNPDGFSRDALFWVGASFSGPCGVYHEEAVWQKKNGSVTFHAGPRSAAYGQHPALDWMWTSTPWQCNTNLPLPDREYVGWSIVASISDYQVVVFTKADDVIKYQNGNTRVPQQTIEVALPKPDMGWFASSALSLCKTVAPSLARSVMAKLENKRTVYIPVHLFPKLKTRADIMARTSLARIQLSSAVASEILADKKCQMYMEAFCLPNEEDTDEDAMQKQFLLNIESFLFYGNIKELERHFRELAAFEKNFTAVNTYRDNLTPQPTVSTTSVLVKGIIGVGCVAVGAYVIGSAFRRYMNPLALARPMIAPPIGALNFGRAAEFACEKAVAVYNYLPAGTVPTITMLPKFWDVIGAIKGGIEKYLFNVTPTFENRTVIPDPLRPDFVRHFVKIAPFGVHNFTSVVYAVVGAPIFEEWYKRKFGWKGFAFIEFCTRVVATLAIRESVEGPLPMSAIMFTIVTTSLQYAGVGVMHKIASEMGFWNGVLFHSLWNISGMFATWSVSMIYPADKWMDWTGFEDIWASQAPIYDGVGAKAVNSTISLWPLIDSAMKLAFFFATILRKIHTQGNLLGEYARFRDNAYIQPWENRLKWELKKGYEKFPPELSRTPTQQFPSFTQKELDVENLTWESTLILPSQAVSTCYYWFLPHTIPGYVPMRSDENLLGVFMSRLCVKPPLEPKAQLKAWKKYFHLADKFPQLPLIPRDEGIDEWIQHFDDGRKRKRYEIAKKDLRDINEINAEKYFLYTEIMVKTDELLVKPGLNPRAIANIDPIAQVLIGPSLYQATKRLSELWSCSEPFRLVIDEVTYYLSYAGAATDEDLSLWLENARHLRGPVYVIIVSGDDSLVYEANTGRCFEGDASMFDQSQSFGPLKFERLVLKRLGVSAWVLEMVALLTQATYQGKSRSAKTPGRIILRRQKRAMRDTGGSDTSVGNSINMAMAWVIVLAYYKDFTVGFAELGFKMKLKVHSSVEQATFLKGMWFLVEGSEYLYWWGPLPSRFLKVGKSLRNPRDLYPKRSFEEATILFLNDLAHTLNSFLQVPLLSAFVRRYLNGPQLRDLNRKYKIIASKKPKPIFRGLDQLCTRYEVPREWWFELEQWIENTGPFTFFQHPLLEALGVDYA